MTWTRALLVFTILCPFALRSIAVGQEQSPAPVYQNGETWQFKIDTSNYSNPASQSNLLNGLYEVSFSNGDFKTNEVSDTAKTEFVDTLGMLTAMFGKGQWHGGQFVAFPLFVGKKWQIDYGAPLAGQGSRDRRMWKVEATAIGVEQVTTAAGTFEAFKIQNKQLSSGTSPVPVTINYYYAPKTKSLVKLSFAGRTGSGAGGKADIELVKFSSSGK